MEQSPPIDTQLFRKTLSRAQSLEFERAMGEPLGSRSIR